MRFKLLAIVAFTFYFSSVANACSVPPEHMYLSHDKTIDDAEWIARVTLESYSDEANLYELKVREYLKGTGPEKIKIESHGSRSSSPQSTQPVQTNYFGHYNSNFWAIGGSYANGTDCKIHPDFKYGGTQYLVFGPKDYNVGYENITTKDDAWLNYVRDYVEGKNPRKPIERSWKKYFLNAAAVVRVRANWKDGRPQWSQDILKGPELDYLHMMYVSPYNYFKEYLDPKCIPYGEKVNARKLIDRIIVFEQLPKKEISQTQHLDCTGANRDSSAYIRSYGLFSRTAHRTFEIKGSVVEFIGTQYFRRISSLDWSKIKKVKLDEIEKLLEK